MRHVQYNYAARISRDIIQRIFILNNKNLTNMSKEKLIYRFYVRTLHFYNKKA